jgi:hypothetical protein
VVTTVDPTTGLPHDTGFLAETTEEYADAITQVGWGRQALAVLLLQPRSVHQRPRIGHHVCNVVRAGKGMPRLWLFTG